jgi:general secretion pathway protein A
VQWLRRQLDISEGADPLQRYHSDRFDEALEIRVRRFQEGRGLVADGVVGPRTMLLLNNLGPDPDTPTLAPSASALAG